MLRYLSKSLCCCYSRWSSAACLYPLVLWAVGQTFFPFQANGSLLKGPDGKPVGSRLIAQPFTKDEYFQPRPSAASYDASASASSSLAASNYALRDRVARALGPDCEISKRSQGRTARGAGYRKLVSEGYVPGQPAHRGPVGEPAQLPCPGLGQGGPAHTARTWTIGRRRIPPWWPSGSRTIRALLSLRPPIWLSLFFENFSKENPGRFPSAVTQTGSRRQDSNDDRAGQ